MIEVNCDKSYLNGKDSSDPHFIFTRHNTSATTKHPSPSDQVSDNKHPSPSEHRTPRTTMKLFVAICLTLVIIAVGEVSGCIQNNCHGKYVWSAHGVQYCCELPTYPSVKRVAYYRWHGTHTKIECRCLSVTEWCNLHKQCS
ncbi:hypothetical protein RRG08_051759 [Elysia crispata]|uniref:Uncharacterized protein n=1 Tax=Elysia crispata TaxID=231223 RepID=A0AAE1EB33_9GAST|nr:hypothetical protein RRG08_051759 [Elysia crispata]